MAKKITDKKITLALDSSNSPLTVAISFGKEIASIKKNGVKQEQFVFNVMDKLLGKKNNITDIKKFFFLKGPGKFTGIRIGLTIASILNNQVTSSFFNWAIMNVQPRARTPSPK